MRVAILVLPKSLLPWLADSLNLAVKVGRFVYGVFVPVLYVSALVRVTDFWTARVWCGPKLGTEAPAKGKETIRDSVQLPPGPGFDNNKSPILPPAFTLLNIYRN